MIKKLPAWKRDYWDVVKKCLVKYHGRNNRQAAALVREYLKWAKRNRIGDILYHEEPFYRACGLVHQELDLPMEQYREEYLKEICGYECHP